MYINLVLIFIELIQNTSSLPDAPAALWLIDDDGCTVSWEQRLVDAKNVRKWRQLPVQESWKLFQVEVHESKDRTIKLIKCQWCCHSY